MNNKQSLLETFHNKNANQTQKGQSIVLVALMMVGILAFAGIAIDTGFTFARSSQLQAGVDAAALAAVTELTGGDILDADTKAGQFLNTNNIAVGTSILKNGVPITTTMSSVTDRTELGALTYALTVTWPVEHYFLKLIGFESTSLTKSATAAYFPLADIYASRRIETGVLNTSNQSLFGPHGCTSHGDPFSPLVRTWDNSEPPDGEPYTYQYRILIPSDYPSDILRVELFDPDSINTDDDTDRVGYSAFAISSNPATYPPAGQDLSCPSSDRRNPCLIQTGEESLVTTSGTPPIALEQVNPFWFVRIDENRGSGTAPGTPGSCDSPGSYNTAYNTETLYQLFYYVQNNDGTIAKVPLANYTGQTGNSRDVTVRGAASPGDHQTDMHWVSPGGTVLYDQPAPVPLDLGSPTTNSGNGFELSISQDLQGILTDPGSGNRYVYLDIQAVYGASENGFEIWAGPLYTGISSNVNTRNIQALNDPSAHAAKGATIFGMGRLPMNSNFSNAVDIPLIYVGPEMVDQSVFISLFDTDAGAQPPIMFYFDSISEDDWSLTFAAGDPDPDGVSGRCRPGSCHDEWVDPSYQIVVPGNTDNCDWNNPTQADCTPFYGGRLMARYIGGSQDTYGWQITVTGLPYLVR